jgi:transposase-like protein/IS1 family transposase
MIGIAQDCTHPRNKKSGMTASGTQRFKCLECGKRFTRSTATLGGMRLDMAKATQVISMLCEGLSIRATARLADVSKTTILELLLVVGQRCTSYLENVIVDQPVKDVSVDELWSFCMMKERTRKINSLPVGTVGDNYCYVGFERNTRLVLAWHSGDRTHDNGFMFVRNLQKACAKDRCQISSDGWKPYKHLIPNHFPAADYGMVIKIFASNGDAGRYNPAKIVEMKLRTIAGNPDESRMNTSHTERFNLTIRMGMRRFTRLTNGFSKSHEHHDAALGLFFMHYNFCVKHGTIKTTPAIAGGLTDHKWTVGEMLEVVANFRPVVKKPSIIDAINAIGDN